MIKIIKKINNIKFPRILKRLNNYYIFGIVSKNVKNDMNKFVLFYEKYTSDFIFIEKKNISHSFETSSLIWDILEKDDEYIFLIEHKSIDMRLHTSSTFKYSIKKEDLEVFKINKIEKINMDNCLLSKIINNTYLTSKIEIDEERPDYYWGKYLFHFQNENKQFYRPEFDKIVNYQKDKGHLLHFIEELYITNCCNNIIKKTNIVIFSIRHKVEENPTNYYYKIYLSYTDNFKKFYNTKEIKIENNITNSNWYCYPEIFKQNNKYYILLNQNDFGKEKETLLGELMFKET